MAKKEKVDLELRILTPEPRHAHIGEQMLTISEMPWLDALAVLRELVPVWDKALEFVVAMQSMRAGAAVGIAEMGELLGDVVEHAPGAIKKLLCGCTELDDDRLDALPFHAVLMLTELAIRVNFVDNADLRGFIERLSATLPGKPVIERATTGESYLSPASSILSMLSAGMPYELIERLTLTQAEMYLDAISFNEDMRGLSALEREIAMNPWIDDRTSAYNELRSLRADAVRRFYGFD